MAWRTGGGRPRGGTTGCRARAAGVQVEQDAAQAGDPLGRDLDHAGRADGAVVAERLAQVDLVVGALALGRILAYSRHRDRPSGDGSPRGAPRLPGRDAPSLSPMVHEDDAQNVAAARFAAIAFVLCSPDVAGVVAARCDVQGRQRIRRKPWRDVYRRPPTTTVSSLRPLTPLIAHRHRVAAPRRLRGRAGPSRAGRALRSTRRSWSPPHGRVCDAMSQCDDRRRGPHGEWAGSPL